MQCFCSKLEIAAKSTFNVNGNVRVNRTRHEDHMISRFNVWEQCRAPNQQHNRGAAGTQPKQTRTNSKPQTQTTIQPGVSHRVRSFVTVVVVLLLCLISKLLLFWFIGFR